MTAGQATEFHTYQNFSLTI